ncbi:MAG: M23 family metallopeptidase, partial [bacterium]
MFVRKISCCFFLGLTGLLFSQDLLWPTDASHLITSTFCEYRPGHFHAGIDIKTWSKTGYKIFAVGDGSVIRIKTSPYNYGRVLFLKLKNDMRIVYGHLSNFSPDIETLVRDEQKRLGRYSLDIHIPDGQLLVKKGDVLGYTGRSGTKAPHLHFEVRDENNQPFNPFIAGFT